MRLTKGQIILFSVLAVFPVLLLYIPRLIPLPQSLSNDTVKKALLFFAFSSVFLGSFLGIKINQFRIFLWCIVMAGAAYVMANLAQVFSAIGLHPDLLVSSMEITLPLSLILIFAFGEGRLQSYSGVIRLFLAFCPFCAVYLVNVFKQQWLVKALVWELLPMDPWMKLSHLGIILLILAIFYILIKPDQELKSFKFAIIFSFLPLYSLFNGFHGGQIRVGGMLLHVGLSILAIGIIYSICLIGIFWSKAYIDELTEIPNRRALEEKFQKLAREFSIAMVDIDHFKQFNDNYGHKKGDDVLRFVAKILWQEAGPDVYRYGGEEFCLIFENTPKEIALAKADLIRMKLADTKFYIGSPPKIRKKTSKWDRGKLHQNKQRARITVSIGIAENSEKFQKVHQVLESADQGLYKAKKKGRNRVEAG